jgi:Co/Zn/Cd efflux system component
MSFLYSVLGLIADSTACTDDATGIGTAVVHQNLPRREKAAKPLPLGPRTFDVLLSYSANRVDPNPTKEEGWAPKRLTSDLVPK